MRGRVAVNGTVRRLGRGCPAPPNPAWPPASAPPARASAQPEDLPRPRGRHAPPEGPSRGPADRVRRLRLPPGGYSCWRNASRPDDAAHSLTSPAGPDPLPLSQTLSPFPDKGRAAARRSGIQGPQARPPGSRVCAALAREGKGEGAALSGKTGAERCACGGHPLSPHAEEPAERASRSTRAAPRRTGDPSRRSLRLLLR